MNILTKEPLQPFNSLALRATAEYLVKVCSEDDLMSALQWAQRHQHPVTVLGAGSNVVLADDVKGLVVIQGSSGIERVSEDEQGVLLRVGAGENWHELVRWSLDNGLYGLENLALIPGTVGAAPIQNIGAYGVEIKSFVRSVQALEIRDQQTLHFSNSQCEFSYRDSVFKHRFRDQLAIVAVDLYLRKTPDLKITYPALAQELLQGEEFKHTASEVFDAVVNIRTRKLPDPSMVPNVGSFFKNPVLPTGQAQKLLSQNGALPKYPQSDGSVKFPAAWFIEECGWKGHRENGVGVHPEHALVLVNHGSDSGARILELAGKISRSVKDRFGVALEPEPRIFGAIQ